MTAWLPPQGAWTVKQHDVAVLHSADEQKPLKSLYEVDSPTLLLPPSSSVVEDDDQPSSNALLQLGLHHTHAIVSVTPPKATDAKAKEPAANAPAIERQQDYCVDSVAFAGGSVWTADFCPPPRGVPRHALTDTFALHASPSRAKGASGRADAAGASARPSVQPDLAPAPEEYVALGVHPAGSATNLTNTPLFGVGAVQLWAVPHGAASPQCPQGLPRCCMLLVHEGCLAWEVRWCPAPGCIWTPEARGDGAGGAAAQSSRDATPGGRGGRGRGRATAAAGATAGGGGSDGADAGVGGGGGGGGSLPVLGLLAMVLGDGSVIVAAAPTPAALERSDARDGAAAAAAPAAAGDGAATAANGSNAAGGGVAPMEGVDGLGGVAGANADAGAGAIIVAGGDGAANAAAPQRRGALAGPPPTAVRLLRPAVVLNCRERLNGSLPSCCDWHLPDPRAGPLQLLVGCWDGSAALWRLPRGPLERTQLLFHMPADVLPLRRVLSSPVWDGDADPDLDPDSDAGPGPSSGPGAGSSAAAAAAAAAAAVGCGLSGRTGAAGGPAGHMFCTTGYTGRVKLWDDRDTSRPLLDRVVHRSYAQDACWTRLPATVAVAMDDGALRMVVMDASAALGGDDGCSIGQLAFKEASCGCLWSVTYVPPLHMLLYGGADGVAAGMAWEFPVDSRNRRPHVPLAGLVRDGPHLRVLAPDEVKGLQLVYPGGTAWRAQEAPSRARPANVLPDVRQQLYVIRAGYGAPPPPGQRPCRPAAAPPQKRAQREEEAEEEEAVVARGRPRGRPRSSAAGVAGGGGSRYSSGHLVGADGGPVWVVMGWQCGVVRFMRLSVEAP